ncbi:MAG TPA: hypothetical protein VK537_07680 [Galbitalea sp.]|nr:hypothetical protein [Galbitalea sp.]
MKHASETQLRHPSAGGTRSDSNAEFSLVDPRHPDDAFIQRELDRDRKREWYLIPKAFIALAIVAVLVVIRQLFFV